MVRIFEIEFGHKSVSPQIHLLYLNSTMLTVLWETNYYKRSTLHIGSQCSALEQTSRIVGAIVSAKFAVLKEK